jgi:hypothetical protein
MGTAIPSRAMSQENAETPRRAIDAANRRAWDQALLNFDARAEWQLSSVGAVAQFAEGKIVRVTMYVSRDDALEAAGLRE